MSVPLQGLEAWGSRCATGVQEIPQRLIVVGGVVACEAATWMSSLGNDVTMLVRGPRLLSAAESFASRFIEKALAARGITVITDAQVVAAERPQASDTGIGRVHGGPVTVTCAGRTIEADEILVPTGRRPPPDRHGAEGHRPEPDDVLAGCLPDWLYAVSDASGEAQLTHMGKYRARVVGERITALAAGCEPEPVPENVPVPQVVFTAPQFASSGLTEQRARDPGQDVVTAQVGYTSAAGVALLHGDAHSEVKLVVDRQTGAVLGATFVGPGAGELVHAAIVAIIAGRPGSSAAHAVPAYPTASEIWLRLIESLPSEILRICFSC